MPGLKGVFRRYYWATISAISADTVIYLAVAAYLLGGTIYVIANGGMLMGALDFYAHAAFICYCLILPFALLIIGIARITHRLERRRRLAYRLMFRPRRVARFIAGTLLMLAIVSLFESMFASVKTAFSDHGFPYERIAADLDKFIHFGHGPVKYLYAVAKNEWVLRAVELNYDVAWFIVCFGILYWVATSPRADKIRQRYVLTFVSLWVIVGNLAAALVPTAGPAFYALVTGDSTRFDKLRAFVGSTAGSFSSAADEQRYLWALHVQGADGFGSGISAFPSMHVALIALNAMFAAEFSRLLGVLVWVYVALIFASSTYLGWHYAIDGYAAILLSALVYWTARRSAGSLARLGEWAALRPRQPVQAGTTTI